MTLADRANAAVARDAQAAMSRLRGLGGDLSDFPTETTPEPTRGAEDAPEPKVRTTMTESHDNATCRRATTTDPVQAVAEAMHADLCPDDECGGGDMGEWERQAEVAVDAARPLIAAEAALTEAVSLIAALRGWADDDAVAGQAKSAHALRFAASMIEVNALPVLRARADRIDDQQEGDR